MPAPKARLDFLLHNHAIVTLSCRACTHTSHPDLVALAVSYGEQTQIGRLKFRCSECGSADIEILFDAGQHGPVTLPGD